MSVKVLVTAASEHGATRGIADAIASALSARGIDACVTPPEDVDDIAAYDAVILGSAVYTGHWRTAAIDFARRFSEPLRSRPVWLFSSGPVGDPERKLVQQMGVDPVDLPAVQELTNARGHTMFAGKLEKATLKRSQRAALLVFRGMEGDFRDWAAIDTWAAGIAESLQPGGRVTEDAAARLS